MNDCYSSFQIIIQKLDTIAREMKRSKNIWKKLALNIVRTNSYVDFKDFKDSIKKLSFINKRYTLSSKMYKRVYF